MVMVTLEEQFPLVVRLVFGASSVRYFDRPVITRAFMRRTQLRREPRFSVNKLAEYIYAGPSKRRSLIVDQIVVPAVKVLGYEHARAAARRILVNPSRSQLHWIDAGNHLRNLAAVTTDEFDARCMRLSAQALEAFAPSSNLIRTNGAVAVAARRQLGHLMLAGVRISLSPEALLLERGSERPIGAVKIHFSKTDLKTDGLLNVAALIHQVLSQSGESPHGRLCIAVDAFAGNVAQAPRAVKLRLRDIQSACEEITERWPNLYVEQVEKRASQSGN